MLVQYLTPLRCLIVISKYLDCVAVLHQMAKRNNLTIHLRWILGEHLARLNEFMAKDLTSPWLLRNDCPVVSE